MNRLFRSPAVLVSSDLTISFRRSGKRFLRGVGVTAPEDGIRWMETLQLAGTGIDRCQTIHVGRGDQRPKKPVEVAASQRAHRASTASQKHQRQPRRYSDPAEPTWQ